MVIEHRVVQFLSQIILVISNRTRAARSFDFEVTRMISDQIVRHEFNYHMGESACSKIKGSCVLIGNRGRGRGSKMGLYCSLGILRVGTERKSSLCGHMVNPLLNKLIQSKWQDSGLFLAHYPTVILTSRFVSKSMN